MGFNQFRICIRSIAHGIDEGVQIMKRTNEKFNVFQ